MIEIVGIDYRFQKKSQSQLSYDTYDTKIKLKAK
jgi:hypothetical protein